MFIGRGTIGESGTAKHYFNFKGVVYVCNEGGKLLSKDEALEKAIEAGAEEVIDGIDDNEKPAFKVFSHTFVELFLFNWCIDVVGLKTGGESGL